MDESIVNIEEDSYADGLDELDDEDSLLCIGEYELTEDFLRQLYENDSAVTFLSVTFSNDSYASKVDWKKEWLAIGGNSHLKGIVIQGPVEDSRSSYKENDYEPSSTSNAQQIEPVDCVGTSRDFFKALALNRSLRHIHLERFLTVESGMFSILAPFFEQNINLRCVEVDGISNEGAAEELITAMSCATHIEKLAMRRNKLGKDGHAKLSALLQNPNLSLRELILNDNDTNDECATMLAPGLLVNSSIERFCFEHNHFISSEGWSAVSRSLFGNNSGLTYLSLTGSSLCHKGATSLESALINHDALKVLDLRDNWSINSDGWQSFFNCLVNSKVSLCWLGLNSNQLDDASLGVLSKAILSSKELEHLDVGSNPHINSSGWQGLFSTCLRNPNSVLEELVLSCNRIGDMAIATLGHALSVNTTIKSLDLTQSASVSTAGWQAFFGNLMEHSGCSLEKLSLYDNKVGDAGAAELSNVFANNSTLVSVDLSYCSISDEGAAALATALTRNSTLTRLNLANMNGLITSVGWLVFESALCDESSIDKIQSSNHVLEDIWDDVWNMSLFEESSLPCDLASYLNLNRNGDKKEVVRQKIIQRYFWSGERNMDEYKGMEFKALPRAMEWVGRDETGHSLLYSMLKRLPSLFDPEYKAALFQSGSS